MVSVIRESGVNGQASTISSLKEDKVSMFAQPIAKSHTVKSTQTESAKTQAVGKVPQAAAALLPASTQQQGQDVDRAATVTSIAMSLINAIAIHQLHIQLVELGAIVETRLLRILNTSVSGPAFNSIQHMNGHNLVPSQWFPSNSINESMFSPVNEICKWQARAKASLRRTFGLR